MTNPPAARQPRTAAGRALVERLYTIFASDVVLEAEVEEVVAAIEAEAAAPDAQPAEGEIQRRCWTITNATEGGTAQCWLYNGHEGQHQFRDAEAAAWACEGYHGLIAVARNAKKQGFPLHCATRETCREHIEAGDDQRTDFAL